MVVNEHLNNSCANPLAPLFIIFQWKDSPFYFVHTDRQSLSLSTLPCITLVLLLVSLLTMISVNALKYYWTDCPFSVGVVSTCGVSCMNLNAFLWWSCNQSKINFPSGLSAERERVVSSDDEANNNTKYKPPSPHSPHRIVGMRDMDSARWYKKKYPPIAGEHCSCFSTWSLRWMNTCRARVPPR